LAQRIEQGIGRGTRGGGDFCVVVLTGNKLVGWISKKKNLPLLTASTGVQLKMGQEISAAVATVKEVGQTVLKCLRRDPDWVSYHASELSEAARAAPVNNFALRVAGGERRAFNLQRIGQYESALATLDKLIEDPEVASDRHRRAWLSALAARIAYQMGDEFRGQRLQTTAFKLNNNHTPPKTRPAYTARPLPSKQSSAIVNHLLEYERRHALLADFDEAVAELVPEASPGRYEEALRNLGFYLGFDAERPEKVYGRGPDVLWRTDAHFDFVIEAKSRKQEDNPLYKNDHAQLLEADHWFKSIYPHRNSVRVSALPEAIADDKATPKGTYAFRLTDITSLVGALRGVLTELIATQGNGDVLRECCEAGLQQAKLLPDDIRMNFMRPFERAD
jgi:replicative superfamily II helicase